MEKNELLRRSGRYCREDAKQGIITNTCSRVSGLPKEGKYRKGDCDERTIGKAGSWCRNEGTCQVTVINSRFDGGFWDMNLNVNVNQDIGDPSARMMHVLGIHV